MAKEQTKTKVEAHVSKFKKKVVSDLVKLIQGHPIIGALNMENMPAASLQKMRAQLRGSVVMFMTKRRIMKHAFEQAKSDKKDIEKLVPYLKGMPALLFTKENPFKLFKILKKNKSPAAAKPGQIAPRDIMIKAGPTPFVPGPVIGELGALRLKTEVKEGKVHIKEDKIVVNEGEPIKANVASLLQRLGIEPMEIGLDLVAVYEDGVIYDKKVLDIDETLFLKNLQNAARWAMNLAVEAGYFTKETVSVLIPKAFREAKAVALEANIMADMLKGDILAKAERQMLSLKAAANIPDYPKAEKKAKPEQTVEEPKAEAPKKEEKPKAEKKVEETKAEAAPRHEIAVEKPKHVVEEAEKPAAEEKKIKKELKKVEQAIEKVEKASEEEKKIEKEVEIVEKKIEKVDEEKKELPSIEKVIVLRKEEQKLKEIAKEKQKAAVEGEKLFEQLKKKGTLRGVKEVKAPSEPKSPEQIIAEAHKKMVEKTDGVPSAHELMKKKMQKERRRL